MKIVLLFASVGSAVAASCGAGFKISASDTVMLPITSALVSGYQKLCPNAKPITVAGAGTTPGRDAVCAGTVDIGMSSIDFKPTEGTKGSNGSFTCKSGKKITQVSVALGGVTLAAKTGGAAAKCIKALVRIPRVTANKHCYTDSTQAHAFFPSIFYKQGGLTIAQLGIIFSNVKSAPKWSDLGSACSAYGVPIKIAGPPSGSNTGYFFSSAVFTGSQTFRSNYVANADGAVVISKILSDPDYIGIISYGGYVKNKSSLSASAIKNSKGAYVLPSPASITDGSYSPLSRYFYMDLLSTSVSAKTKAFVDYALSAAGQAIVASTGFVVLPSAIIKIMLTRVGG